MLKKVMAMALTGMVLCSAAAGAYAADIVEVPAEQSISQTAAKPAPGIMRMVNLYGGSEVYTEDPPFISYDFTTTTAEGKIVRVWYNNYRDKPVAVYLYEIKNNQETQVMKFDVGRNSGKAKEYFLFFGSSKITPRTFKVKIRSTNGEKIHGYLAVRQDVVSSDSRR